VSCPLFEAADPVTVCFFVPGVPQPGGSKKGFAVKTKTGKIRAVVVEDAKHNAPWRAKVSLAASEHFQEPLSGPLSVSFSFLMPRPKGHYGTGRNAEKLKADAPHGHTIKPDVTKLIRSTEDALKGIAWHDDCQVVSQSAGKFYGHRPGCWIRIQPWTGEVA
jgi:Holliday junction resolvase RusA-like endonuclease